MALCTFQHLSFPRSTPVLPSSSGPHQFTEVAMPPPRVHTVMHTHSSFLMPRLGSSIMRLENATLKKLQAIGTPSCPKSYLVIEAAAWWVFFSNHHFNFSLHINQETTEQSAFEKKKYLTLNTEREKLGGGRGAAALTRHWSQSVHY